MNSIVKTPAATQDRQVRSFAGLLEANAVRHAMEPAVSWNEEQAVVTLGWYAYRERVLDVASAFITMGVEPGDAIAIVASNRVEHMLADLAASHCAAVSVSIYGSLSSDQLAHVLKDCSPKILIVEGEAGLRRIASIGAELPHPPEVVVIAGREIPAGQGCIGWSEFEARGRANRGRLETEILQRSAALDPDSAATYIYTSGTTGPSKGVVLTHANLLANVEMMQRSGMFDYAYRSVSYLPLAHVAERLWTLYVPLRIAGHVMCCPDATRFTEALRVHRPSYLMCVPRVWEKLQGAIESHMKAREPIADALSQDRDALSKAWDLRQAGEPVPLALETRAIIAREGPLRDVLASFGMERVMFASSAAAPLRADVTRFFASIGVQIHQGYGLTETGGPIIADRNGFSQCGSIGLPFPGVEAKIADDGELLIRAGSNTPGYRNLPAATRELYTADGWLRTGDVAQIDAAGLIHLTDRKKEIIVTSSGKNVAPTNIESRLAGRSFIQQALVYGDERPYIVALLTVDAKKLLAYAQDHGIAAASVDVLAADPRVVAEAQLMVDEANAVLSRPEQIKRFKLLATEFSVEREELTPTFKLRRKFICRNYAGDIESLYAVQAATAVA
jgi:long-chain acyl-CoA synthetase